MAKKSVLGYQATAAATFDEHPVTPTVPLLIGAVHGDEGRKVPARRLAPNPNALTVDAHARTVLTQPADGCFDVVKARRGSVLRR